MVCLLTLVNALWPNMNKQWTQVFLLTNINKNVFTVINVLFMVSYGIWDLIVKLYCSHKYPRTTYLSTKKCLNIVYLILNNVFIVI